MFVESFFQLVLEYHLLFLSNLSIWYNLLQQAIHQKDSLFRYLYYSSGISETTWTGDPGDIP